MDFRQATRPQRLFSNVARRTRRSRLRFGLALRQLEAKYHTEPEQTRRTYPERQQKFTQAHHEPDHSTENNCHSATSSPAQLTTEPVLAYPTGSASHLRNSPPSNASIPALALFSSTGTSSRSGQSQSALLSRSIHKPEVHPITNANERR